jgi:hypothetical protein
MPKRKPLIDHYGTEIRVQPLMGSIGPCVDVELAELFSMTTTRLTPEQAVELGEWLIEAAEAKL